MRLHVLIQFVPLPAIQWWDVWVRTALVHVWSSWTGIQVVHEELFTAGPHRDTARLQVIRATYGQFS